MKTLQIVGDSSYGGGTTLLIHWCKYLVDEGWLVDILTTDKNSIIEFKKIPNIRIIDSIKIPRNIDILYDIKALFQLVKLAKREGYHVIHTYTATPGFIGRLAGFLSGTPIILHHQAGWTINEPNSIFKKIVYIVLEGLAIAFSTKSICVSKSTYNQGVLIPFIIKSKLITICNGIDSSKYDKIDHNNSKKQLCKQINVSERAVLIGNVSRLSEAKDNRTLIETIGLLREHHPEIDFRLVIAGDGPDRVKLEQLSEDIGLKREVFLLGFRSDIPEFLAGIDIFISPSLREGLSISIMEAMAAGKPIIVTSIEPNAELITHEVTGLIVPIKSPTEIEHAVLRFLQSPNLAIECANAARRKVIQDFSLDNMMQKTLQLYNNLSLGKNLIKQ